MKIRVPEAMTRFECNQKGCCCKGWKIPFQIADFARIMQKLSEEERSEVARGITFVVDDDRNLKSVRLRTVGAERACQFLAGDGRCAFQVAHGAEWLPHICRAFPGYGVMLGDVVDLCFNVECPEVLNRLAESDDPYHIVEMDVDPEHHLADRASFGGTSPTIRFGEREIAPRELLHVQAVIQEELSRRERPALHSLALIFYALARLAKGLPVDEFALRSDQPTGPFDAFFESCVAAHQPTLMVSILRNSRRFVFDFEIEDVALERASEHLVYRPDWHDRWNPEADELQPLMVRYLAHRFHSPFSSSPIQRAMSFAYGTIVHSLATAFRYVAGLGGLFPEADARLLLKVSIGISENLYGTFRGVPTTIMPWFEP